MPAPPPPGPPPPPPPPVTSAPPPASSDRSALLSSIQKGTRLKKATTNDRSGPTVGSEPASASAKASGGAGGAAVAPVGLPAMGGMNMGAILAGVKLRKTSSAGAQPSVVAASSVLANAPSSITRPAINAAANEIEASAGAPRGLTNSAAVAAVRLAAANPEGAMKIGSMVSSQAGFMNDQVEGTRAHTASASVVVTRSGVPAVPLHKPPTSLNSSTSSFRQPSMMPPPNPPTPASPLLSGPRRAPPPLPGSAGARASMFGSSPGQSKSDASTPPNPARPPVPPVSRRPPALPPTSQASALDWPDPSTFPVPRPFSGREKCAYGSNDDYEAQVLFRAGVDELGRHYEYPRTIVVDDADGFASFQNDVQDDQVTSWERVDKLEQPQAPRSEYHQHLERLEGQHQQALETAKNPELEPYSLDLHKIEAWSNYMRSHLPARSKLCVSPYNASILSANEDFAMNSEWTDDLIEDRIRLYAEECDTMQAFQILNSLADWNYVKIATAVIPTLEDLYGPKCSLLVHSFTCRDFLTHSDARVQKVHAHVLAKRIATCYLTSVRLSNLLLLPAAYQAASSALYSASAAPAVAVDTWMLPLCQNSNFIPAFPKSLIYSTRMRTSLLDLDALAKDSNDWISLRSDCVKIGRNPDFEYHINRDIQATNSARHEKEFCTNVGFPCVAPFPYSNAFAELDRASVELTMSSSFKETIESLTSLNARTRDEDISIMIDELDGYCQ